MIAKTCLTLVLCAVTPAAGQVWEVRDRLLERATPESHVRSGFALATGDFDGDGAVDLAVGATGGVVDVYRGGPGGLGGVPWRTLHSQQEFSGFGADLAAGNFDDDPADELAVGAALFDLVVDFVLVADSGAIHVFDLDGTVPTSSFFSQATAGVPGEPESTDLFGGELETGDFDGDGFDDLAVTTIGESVGDVSSAGAVTILYGAAGGLGVAGAQIWHRSGGGIDGDVEHGAVVGVALAAGDFDSDGRDDLAIGAPSSTIATESNTGEVIVLYGSPTGLDDAGQQQIDPLDIGADADHQSFGEELAAGDFDGSLACVLLGTCADDLVIGAPKTDVSWSGGTLWAGRVHLLFGSESKGGLDVGTDAPVDQSSFGPAENTAPEFGDFFGEVLLAAEMDGRFGAELVVGTPREGFDGIGESGSVHLLHGASGTLAARSFQFLWARPGLASAPQQLEDAFGGALAAADFDGDGWGDLAIGLHGRDRDDAEAAGAVQILYGALFADGFERGSTNGWAQP